MIFIISIWQRFLSLSSISGSGVEDDGEKPGNSVTTYGEVTIGALKKQLRKAINDLAEELDEETKEVMKYCNWMFF